jgi:hypothetical protein
MAEHAGTVPTLPQVCGKMTNRGNAVSETGTVEGHYQVNVHNVFLDHLISELETRFTSEF